jgi:hypothetical protein
LEVGGKFVKDALVDLNLLAEEVQVEATPEGLPFMSPDEFLVVMLPHVENAVRQFWEITIQSPDCLIQIAEEPRICRIFAKLHAQALETGLELRLRRAEGLGLLGKWKERELTSPHLRKAASPPLPSSLMGWAEKYRYMRVAGTRFPLIREGPPTPESPDYLDDSPDISA